jgi:hypothetical protein
MYKLYFIKKLMDFRITLSTSVGSINFKTISEFHSLWDEFNLRIKNINYGNHIKEFYIGVICVAPNFAPFNMPRKIKYTDKQKIYVKEGIQYILDKTLEYEIVLDFNSYLSVKNDMQKVFQMISDIVLESLNKIDSVKKIKDFKKESFKKDLEEFFKEKIEVAGSSP